MSASMNIIHNMNLNLKVDDPSLSIVSNSELYRFAHGSLAETIDEIFDNVHVDGNVKLDSLTVDLVVKNEGDVFRQITDALRTSLQSQLNTAVFKAKSVPVTNMLADVFRQYLPMEKSSNLERLFENFAEQWQKSHEGEIFNSLEFSEFVLKHELAEYPNMDKQQVACLIYQKVLQMKNAKKSQDVPGAATVQNGVKTSYEVVDSGLVLLSPYISVLFERTGCVKNGAFLSDDAKRKALAVLKFAAYGTFGEPPHYAALMNVLCGLPVTPAFDADELPKISDSEKELVEGLLKAVIANWKAVGHMSPDGLRGTYFVRPGIFETSEKSDLLTVENKTYDILLDKLPWGYSMVKHPWMEKVLNVKWR